MVGPRSVGFEVDDILVVGGRGSGSKLFEFIIVLTLVES